MSSPARLGPDEMSAILPPRIASEPEMTSRSSTMRALLRIVSFMSGTLPVLHAAKPMPGFYHKGRAGLTFHEQSQPVHNHGRPQMRRKHFLERGLDTVGLAGADAAGQRHMEAE